MKKRDIVFNKFGGRCAYCGCELQKGWHIDHATPIQRKNKVIGGNYVTLDTGIEPTMADIENGNYKILPRKTVADGCHNPQHDHIDNMMPSCASCNINKHSMDIEGFRRFIGRFVLSLNSNSVQYKVAKRYGLIEETNKQVVFYFETLQTKTAPLSQGGTH